MADALRPFALLLVLLNVVFVHSTGAVSTLWVVPLYTLTLLSPWLIRYRERLVFRGAWNGAVLALFGVLLHHATDRSIVYLLEDGLVLAVLCQVHLLNNSGPRQKPDLLFFNSFLIAFVTSFFCRDAIFSLVFAIYIAVLVPALATWSMLRATGGQNLALRPILRRTWPLTISVVACTVLVFAFWPRDFRRTGWVTSSAYQYLAGGETDFDEAMDPTTARNSSGALERIVATIQPLNVAAEGIEVLRLRARTLTTFRHGSWHSDEAVRSPFGSGFGNDIPTALRIAWEPKDGSWYRTAPSDPNQKDNTASFAVEYFGKNRSTVFVPLRSTQVEPLSSVRLQSRVDGTLRVDPETAVSGSLRYRFETLPPTGEMPAGVVSSLPSRGSGTPPARFARHYDSINRRATIEEALNEFLGEISGDPRKDPTTFAGQCAAQLKSTGTYALPGEADPPKSVADFLSGDRAGHCEWFAYALALAVRRAGIPSRVATGWMATERDSKNQIVVRQRHAHAWVEAWTGSRWIALDPTPPNRDGEDGPSMLSQLMDRLEALWASVTTFDETGRRRMVAWLRDFPKHAFSGGSESCVLLIFCGGLLMFRMRRRRALEHPAGQLEYAFRKIRGGRLPHETPREALNRVTDMGIDPGQLEALTAAVSRHERARYASPLET